MKTGVVTRDLPEIEVIGARLAIGAAATTLLLLASLHVLSPAFDPSFRMVSEYALGHYGLVLSLMFLAWGLSSWALAVTGEHQSRESRPVVSGHCGPGRGPGVRL